MDVASQNTTQSTSLLQRAVVSVWYTLRNPKTTGLLLIILVVVLLLGLIIPQQPTPDTPAATWIALLPSTIQPWGTPLFWLGFSQIFQTPWFWAPVALLMLSSVVAMADYTLPSWRRARKNAAEIAWQHPLAQRIEHSVRLPAAPDAFLDKLKDALKAEGFSTDAPLEENQRQVSATRWRWAWLGVIAFYAGLILLSISFLVSHYSLKTESQTLLPLEPESSQLFGGLLELYEIEPNGSSGIIIFTPPEDEKPALALIWQLYRPLFFKQAFVLPIATRSIVTIEARDATGNLLRLLPVQADLSPATRLNLSFGEADQPQYFLIPSADLAFQILPLTEPGEPGYNVKVRHESDPTPSESTVIPGETFEIDDLAVTISPGHDIQIVAYRDLALPLYVISLVIIFASGLVLFFRPPWQVWLIPEVKGRGGQLYGVVEKFRSAKGVFEFLEQLLAEESPAEAQELIER